MKTSGSFWNIAATVTSGIFCSTAVKSRDHVAAHVEVDLAGDEQQAVIDLRSAGPDGDIEAVFLVSAVDDGLKMAAMFGFGQPIGGEGHLVEGLRRCAGDECGSGRYNNCCWSHDRSFQTDAGPRC